MTEAHIALPRPTPPPPATNADQPESIEVPDLALMAAAYAIETPAPDTAELLAAARGYLAAYDPITATTPAAQSAAFETQLWAALGLLLSGQDGEVVDAALRSAQVAVDAPYRADGDVVRFGQFVLGDGTLLGQKVDGQADLLRESALAGLLLHAAAVVRGDMAYAAMSRAALRSALSRFRSPDGSLYAHAVTPDGMAGFGRDTEGEALLGLLCLRLRADAYADELLASVERYAAARLTEEGHAKGYSQNGTMPNINLRSTLLVACFQREAGRFGAARNTLRGLEPLRSRGLLEGNTALTVAFDAALDHRFFTPQVSA